MKATFYTITDEGFFVGAVVLVNSLRLAGHAEEIVVVDGGLATRQRAQLATQCRVVDPPSLDMPLKNAYQPADGEVAVLIDSDIMVTAELGPLIREAAEGRIVAFVDGASDRRFDEWQDEFMLPSPPREQPYLNSGFLAFSTTHWPDLMRWWGDASMLAAAANARHAHHPDDAHNPFVFRDQDSLNAVLMTYVEPGAISAQDARLAPIRKDMDSVRVSDPRTLECENDGEATVLLHCTNRPKPWEPRGWFFARTRLTSTSCRAYSSRKTSRSASISPTCRSGSVLPGSARRLVRPWRKPAGPGGGWSGHFLLGRGPLPTRN